MDYEIPHDLQMPYLRAIQKIPGDTVGEKWRWIGRLASCQSSEDLEQLPAELLPVLRLETAIKKKRHEDITSALKCEDSTIINRALRASWFFDGSHKKIIDVSYFCERLFPYVSVNVRTRIILNLAHRLAGKDPIFAQRMFTAVSSIYDIQTAYPLIIACNEAFAYKTIVEKELLLPLEIANKIFRKNPDLIVRFLMLFKPSELATKRTPFTIGIHRYKSFLPKLIKKRLEAFIELCEIHETSPPDIVLSNTRAEMFLKKAQQHLIRRPLVYIRILPLKKINEHLMETIFPGLLPENISSFKTNTMLDYLKHYPRDKKYDLLRKSYKNKYCAELLDKTENVTYALLQLLPAEERIKQARIKIEMDRNFKDIYENTTDYQTTWICYLPVNEVIPVLKAKINKTSDDSDRLDFIVKMIYVCKINEDDDALSNTLTYLLNRHKNENSSFFIQMFSKLLHIYDVPHLSEKQISLILDIVRLFYVKYRHVSKRILSAIVHSKLIHNMPIEELIEMYLESDRWYLRFDILREYPQYERQCLVTFGNIIRKKSFKDLDEKRKNFCHFVIAMYDFNDRCKKSRIKIKEMTVRDYPWLMEIILEVIRSKKDSWNKCKNVLEKNESKLYRSLFPEDIANVTSSAALALLNRDFQSILNNWEKYLADCIENYHLKFVQRFVKATRWYKDIPILFANRCMNYIYDKNTDKISSSIVVLAILLHGDVVTKLIDPFIPTETTVDSSHPNAKDNYKIIQNLPLSIRLSNPPVPLDLIVRLCEGDYLSIALMALTNVSRRTSLPKVISIAQKLMSMRISTRKHGIRLMKLVASDRQFTDFLQKTWATESHHSVRQVLFEAFHNVFIKNPNPETWSLYCQAMLMLNLDDEDLLSEMSMMFFRIPNEHIAEYLKLWLKKIDDLEGMGLDVHKVNKNKLDYVGKLTASVFDLLSEEFAENILRRFLFHIDERVSEAAKRFTISYILSEDKDKRAVRIKIFADVFHDTVTTYWDEPHPKILRLYPVNEAVCSFLDYFAVDYIDMCFDKSIEPEIIDNMQTIFLSVLSPEQNARSYLMLVYAKKLQESISTKTSFGLRLGQQLQELIDVFSPLLVPFMSRVLRYFLCLVDRHFNLREMMLNVVEGLIEAGNTNSCFMAMKLLPFSTIRTIHGARYDRLIEKLREMEEPIISVFYNYLNGMNLK